MKIVALSQYYLPGSGGGTIRALANVVERFASRHEFWIVHDRSRCRCDIAVPRRRDRAVDDRRRRARVLRRAAAA
jgi:hypothetical protein